MKMIIKEFNIKGIYEIELKPVKDNRGYFNRIYDNSIFEYYNIDRKWVQENHSYTLNRNTIRGLHFQFSPYTETKLVRCIRGEILDVFVDLKNGKWSSIILSQNNNKMIYIPGGFAHGFRTLTDNCEVLYKVDNYYSPQNEGGIIWNDPDLNIDWKFDSDIDKNSIIISEKDSNLPTFKDFKVKNTTLFL